MHLTEQEFQRLAHRTDGFSGSDIQNTCRDALMQPGAFPAWCAHPQRANCSGTGSRSPATRTRTPVRECLRAHYWRPVEVEDAQGRVSRRYVPCADPDVEGAERLDMMQLSPESLVVPDVGLVRALPTPDPSFCWRC